MDEPITTSTEPITTTAPMSDNLIYKSNEITTDYQILTKADEHINDTIKENDNVARNDENIITPEQNLNELIGTTNSEANNFEQTNQIIDETFNNCVTIEENIHDSSNNLIYTTTTTATTTITNDNNETLIESEIIKETLTNEPITEESKKDEELLSEKMEEELLKSEETSCASLEEIEAHVVKSFEESEKTLKVQEGESLEIQKASSLEVPEDVSFEQQEEIRNEPEESFKDQQESIEQNEGSIKDGSTVKIDEIGTYEQAISGEEQIIHEQVIIEEEIPQKEEVIVEGAEEEDGEKVVEVIEIREIASEEFNEINENEQTTEYSVIEEQTDDILLKQTNKDDKQIINILTEDGNVIETCNDKMNDETVLLINYATTNDSTITTTTITEANNIELEIEDESSQEYNIEEVLILNEGENSSTTTASASTQDIKPKKLSKDEQIKKKLIDKIKTTTPKPRGRKPIRDIPLHVLGRDINKPNEGVHNGGRNLPKPRLGVKVPYRNLTSQIVTKEEIQKEIMDRFKSKHDQNSASGDIYFARKLTQRLARKLTTPNKNSNEGGGGEEGNVDNTKQIEDNNRNVNNDEILNDQNSKLITGISGGDSGIKDNSDLIAILEGDEDYYPSNTNNKTNDKEREKEIALQQLNELPLTNTVTSTKKKIFKSRDNIVKSLPTTTPNEILLEKKSKNLETTAKVKTDTTSPKQTITSSSSTSTSQSKIPSQLDVEPQIKPGVVLKTYTRKRKSTEIELNTPKKIAVSTEQKTDKKSAPSTSSTPSTTTNTTPSNVYITKSSRVIKKKVIWDPDEIKPTPNKNLIKSPKPSTSSNESTTLTSSGSTSKPKSSNTDKNSNNNLEKIPQPIRKSNVNIISSNSTSTNKDGVVVVKKRLSEVDRLLMDEGAVNMLYDVKNTTEHKEQNKKKSKKSKSSKNMISLDKAHKELMTKTDAIKNDLQQNVNKQKLLRKKDFSTPTVLTRQVLSSASSTLASSSNTNNGSSGGKKKLVVPRGDSGNKIVLSTPPASPAYQHHAEASRIISRHSSSSFSSSDELIIEDENINEQKSGSNKKKAEKLLESVKKKIKKTSASGSTNNSNNNSTTNKTTENVSSSRNTRNSNNNNNDNSMNEEELRNKFGQFNCFKIEQNDKLVEILLDNKNCNSYLTLELLKELTTCLNNLSNDDSCQAVTITSNVDTFSRGLEYRSLVNTDEKLRKKKATELANCVKDFLLCLLNFQKILIAGIQGDCLGLGVTMLPLFDMVIASDVATFSTPYASLGCVAEGGYLLTVPHLTSHGLASELLFTSQVLKADDAFRRGLITRLCWPEKYNEEFKNIVANVANQSMQSTMASKRLLRQNLFQITESSINNDTQVLINHWVSPECQANFNKYKIEVE